MNAPLGPSSRPLLARLPIRSREYRHPAFWIRVRIACGIFNLCLGVFLVSLGFWEGVLALAGAALIFRTVFLLQDGTPS
jgi:hypothetical protein